MVSGSVVTVWKDADFMEITSSESGAKDMEVVTPNLCCLAYDPDDMKDFINIELQFACLEEEYSVSTNFYDLNTKQCTVTTNVAMYVDYDVDGMYN